MSRADKVWVVAALLVAVGMVLALSLVAPAQPPVDDFGGSYITG